MATVHPDTTIIFLDEIQECEKALAALKFFAESKVKYNIIAAQTIASKNEKLHYWASRNEAEVDFLLSEEKGIIPCEVKSSDNVKSKSLTAYIAKYKPEYAIKK